MAAGLTLRQENFAAFRVDFEKTAREILHGVELRRSLRIDAEVGLGEIDFPLLDEQESMEPFGMGNEQPLLVVRGVTPDWEPRVLKGKHLKFDFRADRRKISAIFFGGAENPMPRPPWDIAFKLDRNEFQGRVEPQMQVVAMRSAA